MEGLGLLVLLLTTVAYAAFIGPMLAFGYWRRLRGKPGVTAFTTAVFAVPFVILILLWGGLFAGWSLAESGDWGVSAFHDRVPLGGGFFAAEYEGNEGLPTLDTEGTNYPATEVRQPTIRGFACVNKRTVLRIGERYALLQVQQRSLSWS